MPFRGKWRKEMGKQDEHQFVTCFKLLFQHCNEGAIYLHFLPSKENLFVPLPEINSIPQILQEHREESCYFGVATRKDGDDSKQGILQIPALCVDIDSKGFKEANDFFERFPLKPTFWIKFRSGYHVCFLLKKPAGLSEVPTVENLLRRSRLALHLGGDPAAINASRIHVPGTLELGKKPEVYFYHVHPDRQYSIHDFNSRLPALPMANPVSTSPVRGEKRGPKDVSAKVKSKSKPSREEKWADYVKRSKEWNISIPFEMLHSDAYKKLDYAPALKVLCWFHEKRQLRRIKGKRGKNRLQAVNGDISFPYWEAILRGLTTKQYSRALKELHEVGFIDIKKPGSALRGDWTVYGLSDRWREYGTPNFKYLEFPKSVHWINFGFGAKKKKEKS
jgi:hypothetical protein